MNLIATFKFIFGIHKQKHGFMVVSSRVYWLAPAKELWQSARYLVEISPWLEVTIIADKFMNRVFARVGWI